MVKSFASLFAPAAIAVALVVDRPLIETLKDKRFWFSVLAGLAVIVPWHATMIYLHGSAFVNEYFYYHVWSRTITALEGHDGRYWFYLREIWEKIHPWWLIAPLALVFDVWQVKRHRSSIVVLALIVLVFVFYTAAQTKSTSYILPVYPALALIISDLLTWFWDRRQVAIRVAVILLCVWFAYLGVGKIRSYYVRIEESDETIKELSQLAGAHDSPQVLILYSRNGDFDPQDALFYSNKRVLEAADGGPPYNTDRYHNHKPLAELVSDQPAGIILWKDTLAPLRSDYAIDIVGESQDLVYATIRKNKP